MTRKRNGGEARRRHTINAMSANNLIDARGFFGHENIGTTNTYVYASEDSIATTQPKVASLE